MAALLLAEDDILQPEPAAAGAQHSVAEQLRHKQLHELDARLKVVKRRHTSGVRWAAGSAQYSAAGAERKRYIVAKLQRQVEAQLISYHGLQRDFRSQPLVERTQNLRLRRKIATAVRLMGEALQQLQRWHAAPGEGAQPAPSPEDLTVEKVLQHQVLPWQHGTPAAGLLAMMSAELAGVSARLECCREETAIIGREAADMVFFYQHYKNQLVTAALPVEKIASCPDGRLPPEFRKEAEAAKAAYRAGRLEILDGKLRHFDAMLGTAQSVCNYVHDPLRLSSATVLEDDMSSLASSDGSDTEVEVDAI